MQLAYVAITNARVCTRDRPKPQQRKGLKLQGWTKIQHGSGNNKAHVPSLMDISYFKASQALHRVLTMAIHNVLTESSQCKNSFLHFLTVKLIRLFTMAIPLLY